MKKVSDLFKEVFQRKNLLRAALVAGLIVFAASTVFAQGDEPPTAPPATSGESSPVIPALGEAAWLGALVAFLKKQFELADQRGKVLTLSFVGALLVVFLPIMAEQFPAYAIWINGFLRSVGLFIGASGGYDLVLSLGGKIKTATAKDVV